LKLRLADPFFPSHLRHNLNERVSK